MSERANTACTNWAEWRPGSPSYNGKVNKPSTSRTERAGTRDCAHCVNDCEAVGGAAQARGGEQDAVGHAVRPAVVAQPDLGGLGRHELR